MDEMKISNGFTKDVISKLIRKVLHKKTGYDVRFQIYSMNAAITNEKALIHVDLNAEFDKSELMKLLKNWGVD